MRGTGSHFDVILNKEMRANSRFYRVYIGVCEAAVGASRLMGVRAWSAPALSVLLSMHTEGLSGVRYGCFLVTLLSSV